MTEAEVSQLLGMSRPKRVRYHKTKDPFRGRPRKEVKDGE